MRKTTLNARQKAMLNDLSTDTRSLRTDWPRRLRNALACLVQCDSRWMAFVERVIDPNSMSTEEAARLIEARARLLIVSANRSVFGERQIGDLIFKESLGFTDSGNLQNV